jgi:hypothetical protein
MSVSGTVLAWAFSIIATGLQVKGWQELLDNDWTWSDWLWGATIIVVFLIDTVLFDVSIVATFPAFGALNPAAFFDLFLETIGRVGAGMLPNDYFLIGITVFVGIITGFNELFLVRITQVGRTTTSKGQKSNYAKPHRPQHSYQPKTKHAPKGNYNRQFEFPEGSYPNAYAKKRSQ